MPDRSAEEIAQQAYDLGFEYEGKYHHCAQSVIAAVQEALDMRDEAVLRAATGLAGGAGLSGEGSCGAFAGGAMLFGQVFGRGRDELDDRDADDKAYELTHELYQRFIEQYGSCVCRGVQAAIFGRSFDLLNPQDKEAFDVAGAHADKCTRVVGTAAQWIAEMVLREEGNELHR
jgi:C_GCAxxG_C_C family probable redox protein